MPGASQWFRGGVVSYASEVKFSILGVPEGPVVSEDAAVAMAVGARRVLGSDVALSVTGVAGPEEQDGQAVGTVFYGIAAESFAEATQVRLPGDRDRVRQFAAISLMDLLRRKLLEGASVSDDYADAHRYFAIATFNATWELIEKLGRTPDEDAAMLQSAFASRWHWGFVGGPEQLATGDWQIAHVASLLGFGLVAQTYALRGIGNRRGERIRRLAIGVGL